MTDPPAGHLTRRTWWAPALLVVAAVAAYSGALSGPFVFDDIHAIVENPHLRSLWPPTAPPQSTVAGRPVISLSLALNHAVGGLDVRGYHTANLAVHVLCGLLLFGIVRRTLMRRTRGEDSRPHAAAFAFSVALLWTVHPLNSETVNYIVQRTESIMALFYLLTLYCAIRAVSSARPTAWSVAAVCACAAGMASKESMVTAPVAVLLYDLAYRSEPPRRVLARRRPLYAGLVATWGLLAALMLGGPRSGTVGPDLGVGALEYARNQAVLIVDYLRLAIWPHPLIFDYGYVRPIAPGTALPYVLLVGALVVAAVLLYLRRPVVGYPAVWFFLLLAPTSSIVPIVSEVGAERRMYLPLAGLVVLAVAAGYAVSSTLERRFSIDRVRVTGLRVVCVALLAPALAWTTHRRGLDYRDAETLWRTVVAARPVNPRGYDQLGRAIQLQGRPLDAIAYYRTALELDPRQSLAQFNMGVALADLGRMDEAIERYLVALELDPQLARAHHNLGALLANDGQLRVAADHFREAVRHAPDWAPARRNLGRALRLLGRSDAALEALDAAFRLDPDDVETLEELAWILATDRDPDLRDRARAVALAERAAALSTSDRTTTLDTLAAAYAEAERFGEAVATAERAQATADTIELREAIERRLRLYRVGAPFRVPATVVAEP